MDSNTSFRDFAAQLMGAEIRRLREENAKLRQFVALIMDGYPENWWPDGSDIRVFAIQCGILIPTKMKEPCGDGSDTAPCKCLETCMREDFPLTCNRLADWCVEAIKREEQRKEEEAS